MQHRAVPAKAVTVIVAGRWVQLRKKQKNKIIFMI
jgi:hypothetical protein